MGKTKNLSVRPTPEELKLLHERAASFGFRSLSQYLIERGLSSGLMIQSTEREKIERLLYEVRKIGVNINQIARRLNAGSRRLKQDDLDRAMREVSRVVAEVVEVLSS